MLTILLCSLSFIIKQQCGKLLVDKGDTIAGFFSFPQTNNHTTMCHAHPSPLPDVCYSPDHTTHYLIPGL